MILCVKVVALPPAYGKAILFGSQGCCFVKYTTLAAAKAAMQTLHNQRSLPPLRNPLQVPPASHSRFSG